MEETTCDRGVYESWVDRGELLVAQPKPLQLKYKAVKIHNVSVEHLAREVIFYQYVCLCRQPLHHLQVQV